MPKSNKEIVKELIEQIPDGVGAVFVLDTGEVTLTMPHDYEKTKDLVPLESPAGVISLIAYLVNPANSDLKDELWSRLIKEAEAIGAIVHPEGEVN